MKRENSLQPTIKHSVDVATLIGIKDPLNSPKQPPKKTRENMVTMERKLGECSKLVIVCIFGRVSVREKLIKGIKETNNWKIKK